MGLFSRKEGGQQNGRSRPMISSEAQAAELRARARRRLIGSVALVLAAVIILPMVLNPEPDPVVAELPIRMPDSGTPFQPAVNSPLNQPESPVASGTLTAEPTLDVPAPPPLVSSAPGMPPAPPALSSPEPSTPPTTTTTPPAQATTPAPSATAKPEPKPAAPAPAGRTDDGSRALALLEGREPGPAKPTPRAVEKGNFVLQIASYSARNDADSRREKLHAAGVTNAFVQPATVSGREQFRLRVGPFPSRDAAQAAQARLRTLGYDNGFIAAQ